MRKLLALASGLLALSLALAWRLDSLKPAPVILIPTLSGQPEYCLTCHADLPEIGASHPVKAYGCVLCHGGERLSLDADLAHSTMRGGRNPSDLAVAEASCGGSDCHSGSEAEGRDHIHRVMTGIQATYAGAIANLRFSFGAQSDLTARLGINPVVDETSLTGINSLDQFNPASETNPMLQEFGENCLTCHLNAIPREGEAFARETGCAACHTPGTSEGKQEVHSLTTAIPYTQCNACHNRGNYDLRAMTFVERNDHSTLRRENYYQPIAEFTQCEYTLDCVDCHTRTEAMGDGDIHSNKKDIQYVQCKTCHGTLAELPLTKMLVDPNDIAFRLAQLNPVMELKPGDSILVTEKGEPLWNTRLLPDGTYEMIGKVTRQRFTFRPVKGTACEQKPEEQESRYCHECHAVKK